MALLRSSFLRSIAERCSLIRIRRITASSGSRRPPIWFSATTSLQATAYYSHLKQATQNGDAAEAGACATDDTLICNEDGEPLTDSSGSDIPNFITSGPYQAYAGLFDNPEWIDGGPYAFLNRTSTRTNAYGASLQITNQDDLFGFANKFFAGASIDHGGTDFAAGTEIGGLTLDRGFAGPGIPVDAPAADITPVGLRAHNTYLGFYLSDAIDLTDALTATLSGRYNRARVRLMDQLGTALNGLHHYGRFNPSFGVTYKLTPAVTAYGRYAESNRIPTPAELSCADPASPCSLTNFFVGDPPLDQVVARTFEAGLRGRAMTFGKASVNWHAGVFTTRSHNDIQYVASGTAGRAYFRNIGATRRRGIEAGMTYTAHRITAYVDYALTEATYRTPLTLNSPNNPSAAADGTITVLPGDNLPGVPRHSVKFGGEFQATKRLALSLYGRAVSGQYLFGDEANLTPKVPGYVVLNAHVSFKIFEAVELYGTVENLLDNHYATFGTFSSIGEVPLLQVPNAQNPRAFSPAPPIAFYAGTRIKF